MYVDCYLMVSKTGNVRVTKTGKGVRANELAIKLTLEIPKSFFERPTPAVTLKVPDTFGEIPIEVVIAKMAPEIATALRVEVDQIVDGLVKAVAPENH